jgi:hypothetical protein
VDFQNWGKTVQFIVTPAVMVAGCGILLSGLLGHYTYIAERIRELSAERLGLALTVPSEDRRVFAEERLHEIDHQVPAMVHRHLQVHYSIMLVSSAIATLILSMLLIGLATLASSDVLGAFALLILLVSTALLTVGATIMAIEARSSHASVAYQAARVGQVTARWDDPTRAAKELDGLVSPSPKGMRA